MQINARQWTIHSARYNLQIIYDSSDYDKINFYIHHHLSPSDTHWNN